MKPFPLLCLALAVSALPIYYQVAHAGETRAEQKPLHLQLKAPGEGIHALALSPDGKTVAAGTSKGKVVLWDLESRKELCRANSQDGQENWSCRGLVFSPDSTRLASVHDTRTSSRDRGRIYLWEVAGGRSLRKVRTSPYGGASSFGGLWQVAFSPDGNTLAAGDSHGVIRLWDVGSGRELLRFQGGMAVSFAPDGRSMISVGHDGLVHRWAAGTNRLLEVPEGTRRTDFISVEHAAFALGGRLVAVGDGYTTLIKDTMTGRTLRRLEFPSLASPRAFSPDGQTLALQVNEEVFLFDTAQGKQVAWRPGWVFSFGLVGQAFAWSDGQSIAVEKTPLAAHRRARPAPADSEPPGVPLQAELVATRAHYTLDLGGLTPEEYSEQARFGYLPSPRVDLTLRLRNRGDKPLTIRPEEAERPEFFLAGAGALNVSQKMFQTGLSSRPTPAPITMAPSATNSIRITALGDGAWSYWVLPGEYTVHATLTIQVAPAPRGSREASDGFGYVSLRCPPVNFRVLPARGPAADPLERIRAIPPLGALVVPIDKETDDVNFKLSIAIPVTFDVGTTLEQAVRHLSERYGIDIRVDEAAFKKTGKDRIGATKLKRSRLEGVGPGVRVGVGAILHLILLDLGATYVNRNGIVWILPLAGTQGLAERLQPANELLLRTLYRQVAFEPGIGRDTPLAEALRDIGKRFELTIFVDSAAFERHRIKDFLKRPVQVHAHAETRPSAVLSQLLPQAGATFVARDRAVVVIPAAEGAGRQGP